MVRIRGQVQGVGFRYWTQEEAEALGLAGWVRNEKDGSVTVMLAGPADAVEGMLVLLRQGPRGSQVTDLMALPTEINEAPPGFTIVR
jgi:acylphosphatase